MTLRPIRSSTVGSCCSAGRYSLYTIDGGTFQVGLMVMYFIVSLSSGVAMSGLPITIRVVQTWLPLCITLSVKSGRLTTTWAAPRSRGYQRQRSMLAMMSSIDLSRGGPLSSLTVLASRWPVAGSSLARWNFFTASASLASYLRSEASPLSPSFSRSRERAGLPSATWR